MTTCKPGTIVLVRFPFTDLSNTKKRPAVVVSPTAFSERYGDVVVLALTSVPQDPSEYALEHWQAAGLLKATWIKPVLGTLSLEVVEKRLGELPESDCKRVWDVLQLLIAQRGNMR